ncbi:MAG TPA: TatD family hydrolase [Candidatus Saccharimonadales bacterium]|nr:TatD family hydrolase [Candidatus Saccharimonadales bacterium]
MAGLTDTHCHIHEAAAAEGGVAEKWHKAGLNDPAALLKDAQDNGVSRLICVGCSLRDSKEAVDFAAGRGGVWASIGIHPHEAQEYVGNQPLLDEFAALATRPKVVAVGECGLDYFYEHSPKEAQEQILRFQIELALQHNLPMIFHVRDAFEDFWKIFDEYKGVRGVIHSFTATERELEQVLARGLYVGLNGIMTFTKQVKQLEAAKAVPLSKLVLETDAPFLTPQPLRGKINTPRHVQEVATFLAELRGESLAAITEATTKNAQMLFGLS